MYGLTNGLQVRIAGHNGDNVCVLGDGVELEETGIELAQDMSALFDEAPIKTIYQQNASQIGATFLGHTIEPKDIVLKFNLWADNGDLYPIYRRLTNLFSPEKESKIIFSLGNKNRTLYVRQADNLQLQSAIDPFKAGYCYVLAPLIADDPVFYGDPYNKTFTLNEEHTEEPVFETHDAGEPLFYNDGDMMMHPEITIRNNQNMKVFLDFGAFRNAAAREGIQPTAASIFITGDRTKHAYQYYRENEIARAITPRPDLDFTSFIPPKTGVGKGKIRAQKVDESAPGSVDIELNWIRRYRRAF